MWTQEAKLSSPQMFLNLKLSIAVCAMSVRILIFASLFRNTVHRWDKNTCAYACMCACVVCIYHVPTYACLYKYVTILDGKFSHWNLFPDKKSRKNDFHFPCSLETLLNVWVEFLLFYFYCCEHKCFANAESFISLA